MADTSSSNTPKSHVEKYEVQEALAQLHNYFKSKTPASSQDVDKVFLFLYQLNRV